MNDVLSYFRARLGEPSSHAALVAAALAVAGQSSGLTQMAAYAVAGALGGAAVLRQG